METQVIGGIEISAGSQTFEAATGEEVVEQVPATAREVGYAVTIERRIEEGAGLPSF
jgi:hypothetical protein